MNFYETLGVTPQASEGEIKKAYRILVKKWHPDANPDDPQAAKKFLQIQEAFTALTSSTTSNQKSTSNSQERPQKSAQKSTPTKKTGDHFKYIVSISLEEAAEGCTKSIQFIKNNKDGQRETIKLSVPIPPGVENAQLLKVRGEGESGQKKDGDLFVQVHIEEHPLFKQEGRNIYLDLPLSLAEVYTSSKIKVPTLYGWKEVTLPKNLTCNQVLRLKSKGYPRLGGFNKGDQYIKILFDVPQELSPENLNTIIDILSEPGVLKTRFKDKLKKGQIL